MAAPVSSTDDVRAFTLHVGTSRMGKTHTLVRVCEAHERAGWRVVVVDAQREWAQKSKRGALVCGARGASDAEKRGHRLLVWQPRGDEALPDIESVCQWVIDAGRGTLLAIPEAHLYFTLNGTPPLPCRQLLTGYGHRGVSLLLDTQRPSALSPMARENAGMWRVFGLLGDIDQRILLEKSRDLLEASMECARRRENGQPGWFVEYFKSNLKPVGGYRLQRM